MPIVSDVISQLASLCVHSEATTEGRNEQISLSTDLKSINNQSFLSEAVLEEVERSGEAILKLPPITSLEEDQIHAQIKLKGLVKTLLHQNEQEYFYLLRKKPSTDNSYDEIRLAVVGNVDAGKSTILGVLTKGILDDGRGLARVQLFRHKHEKETGRTSSVGHEHLAFDVTGKPLRSGENATSQEQALFKLINFIDLAGHERYLKTTIFGLTGFAPDYAMLMIGSNAGLVGMTKEHLSMAFSLNVPVMLAVTKIDMCPAGVLEETLKQIHRILRSSNCKRVPVVVKGIEDVLRIYKSFVTERLCPIFLVSNVTGEGIGLVTSFLNLLTPYKNFSTSGEPEFEVNDHFSVPGAGTVVSGTLIRGTLRLGQQIHLGPLSNGEFIQTSVKGIQRKRVNVDSLAAGQHGSIALKKIKRPIVRKGMVLLGGQHSCISNSPPKQLTSNGTGKVAIEFEAEVLILFHSSTLAKGYQSVLHCGPVRQTACIVELTQPYLRTGDRSLVKFRFLKRPEFLHEGARLLFREGRTKGVGRITKLFPLSPKSESK
jgi:GTPase